jgi:isoleucyl-tRNA synthetase
MTLWTVLSTVTKISAPFVPFMAEEIYQNLVKNIDKNAPASVHLCDFPVSDEKLIDKELEDNMENVLQLVVLGRACRNTANIKNRQPIGNMYVKAGFTMTEMYMNLVADELNIKKIIFTDDAKAFTVYKFKPQLRTLGPKYGKLVPKIGKVLAEIDSDLLMVPFGKGETARLEVEGNAVELAEADVLIEVVQKQGFVSETDKDVTVVLDTNLTPELIEEGFVREIISKIQTMRKEAGFEVMDNIKVYYNGSANIENIIKKNSDEISGDVLAKEITDGKADGYEKEWNINGEKVDITVIKA